MTTDKPTTITDARPATITVYNFFDSDVFRAWCDDKCEVSFDNRVIVSYDHDDSSFVVYFENNTGHTVLNDSDVLSVKWLPTTDTEQQPSAPANGETGATAGDSLTALEQKFNALELEYASELQFEIDTFDKIWSVVTADKMGKWDYPAQVVRHVEHMRDNYAALEAENARLREALDAARKTFVVIQAYPDTEFMMSDGHLIAGMIQQAEFGAEQAAKAAALADGEGA